MSLNRVVFTLLLLSGIADFQLVAHETETDQKTVDEVKRGSARGQGTNRVMQIRRVNLVFATPTATACPTISSVSGAIVIDR